MEEWRRKKARRSTLIICQEQGYREIGATRIFEVKNVNADPRG